MSAFVAGDKVKYLPSGQMATVVAILPNDGYVIEFDSQHSVPPTITTIGNRLMAMPINLSGGYRLDDTASDGEWGRYVPTALGRSMNKETHCPKCGKEWSVTPSFRSDFYDCFQCNLKRENA